MSVSEDSLFIEAISGSAQLQTAAGPRPLQSLSLGDLVETRDNGLQQITLLQRIADPVVARAQIVSVSAGVLGATAETSLCGGQPFLLKGWLVAALFANDEVLARIGTFSNGAEDGAHVRALRQNGAHPRHTSAQSYYRIGFDRPQLISCDGIWLSSHSEDSAAPRPFLAPQQESSAAESGLFIRRAGEAHARPRLTA